jgi:hypothetical protein
LAQSLTLVQGRSSPDPALPVLNRECQAAARDINRQTTRLCRSALAVPRGLKDLPS